MCIDQDSAGQNTNKCPPSSDYFVEMRYHGHCLGEWNTFTAKLEGDQILLCYTELTTDYVGGLNRNPPF